MAEFIVIQFFQNSNIVFHEGKDHGQGPASGGRGGGGGHAGEGRGLLLILSLKSFENQQQRDYKRW